MYKSKATAVHIRRFFLLCLGLQAYVMLRLYTEGNVSVRELSSLSSDLYRNDESANATFSVGMNHSANWNGTADTMKDHVRSDFVHNGQSRTNEFESNLPLDILVQKSNSKASDCDKRLFFMEDTIIENNRTNAAGDATHSNRKIPKLIHVTGKTRCLHVSFFENLNRWKEELPDHSFYFHDEAAVDELLQQKYWTNLFPQLEMLQHCMISGAAKADLWRYLVLYKYGGIYTDMDSAPGVAFRTNLTGESSQEQGIIISDDDDSFFIVEKIGVLSQYFMATSPRHPLMYLAILNVFDRLMSVESVTDQYVPYITGPGALKSAFIEFMGGRSRNNGKVKRGTYTSPLFANNRSITVIGTRRTTDRYVHRESIPKVHKKRGYKLMGMTHFSSASQNDPAKNVSCFAHLYNTFAQESSKVI